MLTAEINARAGIRSDRNLVRIDIRVSLDGDEMIRREGDPEQRN